MEWPEAIMVSFVFSLFVFFRDPTSETSEQHPILLIPWHSSSQFKIYFCRTQNNRCYFSIHPCTNIVFFFIWTSLNSLLTLSVTEKTHSFPFHGIAQPERGGRESSTCRRLPLSSRRSTKNFLLKKIPIKMTLKIFFPKHLFRKGQKNTHKNLWIRIIILSNFFKPSHRVEERERNNSKGMYPPRSAPSPVSVFESVPRRKK